MKKSLLALAVLSAVAGAASAQTNVTIYGIVDAAINRFDTNEQSAQWVMSDGNGATFDANKNGSRLGFKGTEDLGGGLSALFVLENGFNVDTGAMRTDGIFSRQAFVGLKGGFGTVKFGRQYTPMFIALDTIDPFNTGFAGNMAYVFNPSGLRTSNTINFSMAAAGLNAEIAYTLGEQATGNSDARQIGLGLGYANGPINVQFAYHNANENPSSNGDTKTMLLGGTFDLGVAKLHAGFQTDKTDLVGTVNDTKDRNVMLGVSAPVGAGNVMASWNRGDNRLAASNADVTDQYAIGYVHNLSKRTNVYTSFGYSKEEGGRTGGGDLKSNLFNVGVQHKF